MAADVLAILIKTNLAAAAAILIVISLRKPTRKVFGARVTYRLWLAVPIAVLASLLPARTVVISQVGEIGAGLMTAAPTITMNAQHAAPIDLASTLTVLWLVGASISFVVLVCRQASFVKRLGGVVREGRYLRAKAAAAGPAVLGALRPRIVLPADFEQRYDASEQKVVLAHEGVHLATGDAAVNTMSALAQCLFWFNPLIHMAGHILRIDQEFACDAAVLAAHPNERRTYAEALLKTQLAVTPLPLGCYWPAGGSNPLKERIAMLKFPSPSRTRRLCGGAGVIAVCLGAGFATWAAQPARVVLANAPVSPIASVQAHERPADKQLAVVDAAPTPNQARSPIESGAPVEASDKIAVSIEGRTFERVNAPPSTRAPEAVVVTTADGRVRTFSVMTRYAILPRAVQAEMADLEPESVREARLVIARAMGEQAGRAEAGRPPQPLTPELAAALSVASAFDREQGRRAREYALAVLNEQIAKQKELTEQSRKLRAGLIESRDDLLKAPQP